MRDETEGREGGALGRARVDRPYEGNVRIDVIGGLVRYARALAYPHPIVELRGI